MKQTWKALRIEYMNDLYGRNVSRYERELAAADHLDDRMVYIIIYNKIMEMLDTLPDEPHLYVKVAISDKMKKDTDMMKEINLHFTGEEF